MSGVYANGLAISGKATSGKTIAAFPDTCFTPPENPATPPGVPVPYPSFGMASDAENGTGTVKIGGKTVNIKNKSDLSKTSGTEAGAAAKKGVITSKNTGKGYFNSWSSDVKFDGEPVIRFTDLATNNHASPTGNTPPWQHVLDADLGGTNCAQILVDCNIELHKHQDSTCASEGKKKTPPEVIESEHMCQNAFFQNVRGGSAGSIPDFGGYSANTAPCICMGGPSGNANTPHGIKTVEQRRFAASMVPGTTTVKDGVDNEMANVYVSHPAFSPKPVTPKQAQALKCLEDVIYAYLEEASKTDDNPQGLTKDQIQNAPIRQPRGAHVTTPSVSPPVSP